MSQDLFNSIHQELLSRLVWENKQRLYYQMRHDGLRRRRMPFPTAADMHYPEIDMAIRKLKPFWMGQIRSGSRLAQFVSMRDQLEATTDSAADYFDFTLIQRSALMRKLRTVVDTMLLRGRGVLKSTVDPFEDYRLVFENVDPLYLIVPDMCTSLKDADEFVHVLHLTVPQYKRDRRYNQDADVISKIIGSVNFESFSILVQDKRVREGITHNRNPNSILLWEHYVKTMGGWQVHAYSPQHPDVMVREPFGVPYVLDGKQSLPFFSFTMEVKDEGWYSPRGLAELLAPVEQYLCKLWNEKADAMTYGNRPVFTSDGEILNSANIRWQPGEFIPKNVKAVQMPPPPYSFDSELGFARSIGEEQSQAPDFGITKPGQPGQTDPRTATENNRISSLQQAGVNDNGSFFREDLADLYRHVWALECQYAPLRKEREKSFAFWAAGKIGVLKQESLHDQYLIAPDGSPEGWDRMQKFQKSVARLQMWKGDPQVDQDYLKRRVMADDDAQFALKAFIPSNQKSASESQAEALDIVLLQDGFPAAVLPGEDHAARLFVDLSWLIKQQAQKTPVKPQVKMRVFQHLQQHWQYLKATQPKVAQAMAGKILQLEKMLSGAGKGNAPGGPPGAAPGPGGSSIPGGMPPAASPSQPPAAQPMPAYPENPI